MGPEPNLEVMSPNFVDDSLFKRHCEEERRNNLLNFLNKIKRLLRPSQ